MDKLRKILKMFHANCEKIYGKFVKFLRMKNL